MALNRLDEVRDRLRKRWNRGIYLTDATPTLDTAFAPGADVTPTDTTDGAIFPLRESTGTISARALREHYEQIRTIAAEYRAANHSTDTDTAAGAGSKDTLEVEWTPREDRHLGSNLIPTALHFPTVDALARFLGRPAIAQLKAYRKNASHLLAELPHLHAWITTHPMELTRITDTVDRLIAVTHWMQKTPRPGIYIRQIPVDGIDTKFVEQNRTILTQWWDILLPPDTLDGTRATGTRPTTTGSINRFAQRYGFRTVPVTLRFRLLDPKKTIAGFTDLTVPVEELAASPPPNVHIAFVVENEISALAFPPVTGGIVICGGGYSVAALAHVPWLKDIRLYYWGDIDTHGFAILNRLRSHLPDVHSFLMDRDTLTAHSSRWSRETTPSQADLPHLTQPERQLYDDLRHNHLAPGVRLEQERIDYSRVITTVKKIISLY